MDETCVTLQNPVDKNTLLKLWIKPSTRVQGEIKAQLRPLSLNACAPPRPEALCWKEGTAWREQKAKAQQSGNASHLLHQRAPRHLAVYAKSTSRGLPTPAPTLQHHVPIGHRRNTFLGQLYLNSGARVCEHLSHGSKPCARNELRHIHLQLPIVPVELNSTAVRHELYPTKCRATSQKHSRLTHTHTSNSITTAMKAMLY